MGQGDINSGQMDINVGLTVIVFMAFDAEGGLLFLDSIVLHEKSREQKKPPQNGQMFSAFHQRRVSQTKNKVFTIYRIFGFISIFRRFAFNISIKWMCFLNRSLIGAFSPEDKLALSLVLRFCDWDCGHWPIQLKYFYAKIRLDGRKWGWALLFSSKRWKTSLFLWRFFQREKEKNQSQFAAKRK